MTPPIILYMRIYEKHIYVGITKDMNKRQHEHDNGKCRTTNKYNKSGKLKEIRYADIFDESYEKTFKKYSTKKKLKLSSSWKIWDGRGEVTI